MDERTSQLLQALAQSMQQMQAQMPQMIAQALEQSRQQQMLRNIQKEYSYKSFICTTKYPQAVMNKGDEIPIREPGTMYLYIPKHFILLDTQTIGMTQKDTTEYALLDVDSDSVTGRTIYNHHMFLPDHPFIYLASYADCTQAITAPGVYVVPDYRSNKNDEDMIQERQIVYALVCNNYHQ